MSDAKHKTTGRHPNDMYCARLVELAFPDVVRVQGNTYRETELGAALEVQPGLLKHVAKRYFMGSKEITVAKVLGTVFPKTLTFQGTEYTKAGLVHRLPHDPKLQNLVAVHTHFVPSKWLLEQEMLARRAWLAEPGAEDVYTAAARTGLTGVCFSGGGIRSATFNLGVIQGLAQLGLLPHIDYLSSVAGGGYIHEFLAAWILRNPRGRDGVIEELVPQAEPGCLPRSPEPIKWLRRYASYLTPARGIFSTDIWTMLAIWMRNTILNQIPIVATLSFAFLLVHLLVLAPAGQRAWYPQLSGTMPYLLWAAEVLVAGWAVWSLWQLGGNLGRQRNMRLAKAGSVKYGKKDLLTNEAVQWKLIVPWLGFAVWTTYWVQMGRFAHPGWYWVGPGVFGLWVFAVALVVIFAGGAMDAYCALHEEAGRLRKWGARCLFVGGGLVAALAACGVAYGLTQWSGPAAQALSDWIGPLHQAKAAATSQSLQFTVSGMAEGFKASLAGTLNAIKGGSGGVRVDPWRIQLVMMPGLLLSIPYISIELALGLLGRDFSDIRREWLARLRAWSLLYALLWAGVVGVALLGPYAGYFLLTSGNGLKYSSIATFIAAHITTVLTGWSGKSDGKPTEGGFLGFKTADLVALLAAPVTTGGLLIGISCGTSWLVGRSFARLPAVATLLHLDPVFWRHFWIADGLCLLAVGLVALLFGWRVDINEFSMQLFYRNRLSRCYLAATVQNRQADPFTGFDGRGDLPGVANPRARRLPPSVIDLLPDKYNLNGEMKGGYDGPFPIFCTTLNLTTGADLATQERKGTSFAFTPLYSGYSVSWTDAHADKHVSYNGYVPTHEYAYPKGGIHLDTAVAISGAAVNPNMGYNSNPALAFLMTFFNVRLGWWITNTRRMDTWRATNGRVTPKFALGYLLKELFGMVNDGSPFVNLSDGGHFENMGLYELVRRRCRYIVVCDAEEDPGVNFDGMGGAITKCRSDFGAEIDLDLRPLRVDEKTGYSQTHCVVGTIRYPPPPDDRSSDEAATECECLKDEEDDKYTGVIVYMKSSLVGDEPPDLLAYKLAHGVFPQDATANQWFTETQFEAYRRLGHHVTLTAIRPALSPKRARFDAGDTIEALFQRMYAIWYPRTPEMEKHLSDHLRQYEGVLSELRGKAELAGLEALLFDPAHGETERVWIGVHTPPGQLAFAMQFGNSLLDFMATVYLNLGLAFPDKRNSPHAEWWICLFRRWCRVDILRKSWTAHAASYPLEFRLFARRELGLPKVAGIRE
jgi:hypothetical protein